MNRKLVNTLAIILAVIMAASVFIPVIAMIIN